MNSVTALRAWLQRQLDPEAWPGAGLSPTNIFFLVLILLSIGIGILATEPSIEAFTQGGLITVERVILVVFLIEFLARVWVSGLNPRFQGTTGLIRYVTRPASLADIIVLIPLFVSTNPSWAMIFRLLRILRLIRLASMPEVNDAWEDCRDAIAEKRFELGLTAAVGAILVIIASTALFLIEGPIQPEIFGSIPRAMWWSVVTFTTVGYGDAVPVTAIGKICTGTFAICGVAWMAMLTGVIASALSDAADRHRQKRTDPETPLKNNPKQ